MSEIIGAKYTTTINRREKGNWTPNDIEKLANYFNRPIAYYFDMEEGELKNSPDGQEQICLSCKEKQGQIDDLEKELSCLKSKYIDALEELQNKKDQGKCG
ncbi:hypothetical protein [Sunxiuqinia sp. sy24]|uniref:hypothetical protein n=1 Tax=Sunxiuqinia sp. sy24 TaxID=3461495 RepID=UPI00404586DE